MNVQSMTHRGLTVVGDDENTNQESTPGTRTISAQNDSVLSRALNESGLSPVGRAINKDHTYISRFRTGEQKISLKELLTILDTCGLRLVSAGPDMRVIDESDYVTLLNLANKGLRALNNEVRGV